MIDLQSGKVRFDDGFEVSCATTIAQLERSVSTKRSPATPDHTQLSIGAHISGQRTWGVGAIFFRERLKQIWLQCLNADGVDPDAWDIGNEKARKKFHDEFLMVACFGKSVLETSPASLGWAFSWGKISSVIDMRGVQALIVVDY
ncbi:MULTISPECIES: hypothetical protein [Paraburkholderia]|jgi:hypothetical protein|uniref:Uncharacterized protein n=1 Tax=Paraburkholderia madseniana TaxID=2599607 RepID=A0A6N6W8Q7_9BURK|nr:MULTISPECIES: hypothetical protein [Paraburkholderia]KAE8755940.1 hypothetical protein FSO04_31660 [Paraburkholderia madseniana]MCX4177265.1 hypothetical protein [Paraburkholderia madseniana]MDQ6465253.1 hypothetical protein [Paraburkholderia madseniana]NPT68642.1 hypothetical protein [Paraburkholderia madseniana]